MRIVDYTLLCCIGMTFLFGCKGSSGESRIAGSVNYNGSSIGEVSIEVYLKDEKDRSTPPFSTGESAANGTFELTLPAGRYFIIARKRFMEGGITRMLLGEYPKNPVELPGGKTVTLAPFSLFNMGEDKSLAIAGAGIAGKVTKDGGGSAAGSFVYVYPDSNPGMLGPSYVVAKEVKEDGAFKINLLPGKYHIAVRRRANRTKLGVLKEGDYTVDYKDNPATIVADEYLDIGELTLHPADSGKLKRVMKDEVKIRNSARVTGTVTDEENEPAVGIYVYAYKDPKMVGKPAAISRKTDESGGYSLYLFVTNGANPSKYYIGARTNYGGPLEPGEYVGTYNENTEHSLTISNTD